MGTTFVDCNMGGSELLEREKHSNHIHKEKDWPVQLGKRKPKESSPSSASSEKSRPALDGPTIEEQVEKLGDVMKICGIKASKIMQEVHALGDKTKELCPVIFAAGAWQQLTIALFQEACGIKYFQPMVIAGHTEPNIRDLVFSGFLDNLDKEQLRKLAIILKPFNDEIEENKF